MVPTLLPLALLFVSTVRRVRISPALRRLSVPYVLWAPPALPLALLRLVFLVWVVPTLLPLALRFVSTVRWASFLPPLRLPPLPSVPTALRVAMPLSLALPCALPVWLVCTRSPRRLPPRTRAWRAAWASTPLRWVLRRRGRVHRVLRPTTTLRRVLRRAWRSAHPGTTVRPRLARWRAHEACTRPRLA